MAFCLFEVTDDQTHHGLHPLTLKEFSADFCMLLFYHFIYSSSLSKCDAYITHYFELTVMSGVMSVFKMAFFLQICV